VSAVRVVLDSSALLAWLTGDTRAMPVAELLATIAEENDALVAVGAHTLVGAYRHSDAKGRARLVRLVDDPRQPVAALPLLAADVPGLVEVTESLPAGPPGDGPDPHAVLISREHDAYLATYAAGRASRVLNADQIIDLSAS
jgi:hypothetical protein